MNCLAVETRLEETILDLHEHMKAARGKAAEELDQSLQKAVAISDSEVGTERSMPKAAKRICL